MTKKFNAFEIISYDPVLAFIRDLTCPPIPLHVCEHQAPTRGCPRCGRGGQALFRKGVNAPTPYGPKSLAQAVCLNRCPLIPVAKARAWFAL